MSSDKRFQIRLSIAVMTVAVCAVLYSWGGVEAKFLRRFVMPFVFFASAFWLTKDWKVLIQAPFAILGLCLGYGAEAVWLKVLKRAYCGLLISSGLCLNLAYVVTATAISIVLGVLNPFPARVEEMILGAVYSSAIFLYVKETV